MRILHVLPSLARAYGGPVTNTVAASHALQKLGAEVSIYSVDSGTIPQSRERRVARSEDLPDDLAGLDTHLFSEVMPHRLAASPALARALVADVSQFDVVHIHQLFLFPQFAAWRASTKAGVPYIVSPRGSLDPYLRARGRIRKQITDVLWQRRMLDNAAALHLTSQQEMNLLLDLHIRAPHRIVPNGIDILQYRAASRDEKWRRELLGADEGLIILNHGRLARKKGLDVLLESFSVVQRSIPNAHLVFVGPDDEDVGAKLRSRARELGLVQRVHLIGSLHGTRLRDVLAATDIWVLPSYTENFGNAVIEAMAIGLPVVTSPFVNIAPDAHRDGALEMVPNTSEQVAGALMKLARDSGLRSQLAANAAKYAKRFDWDVVASQLLGLYEEVASTR